MSNVFTPEQMRAAELETDKQGTSLEELMNRAGFALAEEVKNQITGKIKKISFMCGCGNNGGDGLVAAASLVGGRLPMGTKVLVYLIGEPKTELAKNALERLEKIISATKSDKLEIRRRADDDLYFSDIVVDCIYGTGFHGELSSEVGMMLKKFRYHSLDGMKIIACDCPSGVNCKTGEVSEGTLECDMTVTFHAMKLGMCIRPALGYCGKMVIRDIGIINIHRHPDLDLYDTYYTPFYRYKLHERPEHCHKGTFGRVLLVCGSESYIGAAAIASRAALRSGCGITELAAPKAVIQAIAGSAPECVYTPLPCDENGFITEDALPILLEHAKYCTACVVGCGLGQTGGTEQVVLGLIRNLTIPLIIDADGINILSRNIDVLREKKSDIALTPHMREMSRLCGVKTEEVIENRIEFGRKLAQKYDITIHLKDSTCVTFVNNACFISNFGCPALAKGGTGDMLAGVIGSIAAQGEGVATSCMLGTYTIGRTAQMLSETCDPAAITASDIISEFKYSLKKL